MTDYQKMTDEEIAVEVATKVMGWYNDGDNYWSTNPGCWDDERMHHIAGYEHWDPASRWDHAGLVLARLRSMDHVDSVSIIIDDEHANCGITTRGRLVPDWRGTAPADQPGRAICLAALAAVEARDGL
jgi:hypothetical protein